MFRVVENDNHWRINPKLKSPSHGSVYEQHSDVGRGATTISAARRSRLTEIFDEMQAGGEINPEGSPTFPRGNDKAPYL
jgi:hypothetical protein